MSDEDTPKNVHTLPKNKNTPPTASLDDVLKEIGDWRANKPNASTAIPDPLWRKIFALETTLTASKIRVLLGISTKQYNSKYEQIFTTANADKKQCPKQPQAELVDLCQVKKPQPSSSTSMYKPQKIPATNTIIAEFLHADGRIMKIHSTSDSVLQLIQAFFKDIINAADHI